jgi:hypothetical protein
MKKILIIISLLFTFSSYSQTEDYKQVYEITKQLNTQYKLKITSLDSVVYQQDLYVQDLQSIILVKTKLSAQDSLHISLLTQQTDFLNKNINLYKKELDRRDKFWNRPIFGVILGVAGTVGLVHVIDYSLPR